jgi:Trk-type K+ transport system membrane component
VTDPIFWYLSDTKLFFGVASTSTVVGLSTGALDGPLIKVPLTVTRKLLNGVLCFAGRAEVIQAS